MLIVAIRIKDLFAKAGRESSKLTTCPDCGFQFRKRSQLFMRAGDETFSVATRVNDPDYSPVTIHRCDVTVIQPTFRQTIGNNDFAKTAAYSDCVTALQRASQKRNSKSQPRNDSATLSLVE